MKVKVMAKQILKASGKQEPFDTAKFTQSLQKAAVEPIVIQELITLVKHNPRLKTTKDIYRFVHRYLKIAHKPSAVRYNIKTALYQLGPTGYVFEKYVAALFSVQKYRVQTDQIILGMCVEHEIDVIAKNTVRSFLIECKFHHQAGIKTDVKVTLYVKARFEDIKNHTKEFQEIWLVTNTKFTSQAIKYAQCADIKLLGWSYPERNNIA